MRILVSSCLLGISCRYDGKSKPNKKIISLMDKHTLIPVCPESLGGLPIPRVASEICENRVISATNKDVTKNYKLGAEETLKIAKLYDVDLAILKEKSPSCGYKEIYDGTFSRNLIKGMGITAKLLSENNIKVLGENSQEINKL